MEGDDRMNEITEGGKKECFLYDEFIEILFTCHKNTL